MVVMFFPAACETGVVQERVSAPFTWTLHAPQYPAPHPNLVPVNSSVSRRTHSSGVSGSTVTFLSEPLTRSVNSGMGKPKTS